MADAEKLLGETLEEEKRTDMLLSKIAGQADGRASPKAPEKDGPRSKSMAA